MAKRSYLKVGGEIRFGEQDRIVLLSIDEAEPPLDGQPVRYALQFTGLINGHGFVTQVDPGREVLELRPGYVLHLERVTRDRLDFAASSPEHITVRSGPDGEARGDQVPSSEFHEL